jgi:dTDP-4-amino-4,6-dideoxygalactose transaminase
MSIIEKFEESIAKFYGAPFAVATDCCTHAIELCLIHSHVRSITCPAQTYISVPFTLEKLRLDWKFENQEWQEYYFLGNTNIVDAAVYWKQSGYIPNTLMCLSFQFKKHLSLGRGGAILCDNKDDYIALKKLAHDGRIPNIAWMSQDIDSIGYHYYMTTEIAQQGLDNLASAINSIPKIWNYSNYPYLPNMTVFK